MRIAYVTETYPPELNGVSLTVERTVAYLRGRGQPLLLIRPRQPGEAHRDDGQEWRTAGCPIPMYPDLRFGVARAAALRARLAATGSTLVHLATPGPLAWAALRAARSLGIPVTSDFRTNFHQYSRYYGLGAIAPLIVGVLRRFHNGSCVTFVPTTAARDDLAARGFNNLAVVGRGVDTSRFAPQKASAELRLRWRSGEGAPAPAGAAPVLLYVGRVAAEKNIELALQAFDAARRAHPGTRLVVVGDGPLCARLAAAHPAALFVGVQRGDALAEHYASADLFLFPSLSDTFGNVTLEALASGLPVVAFNVAAAAEHVVDGESGALVPAGDEGGFIDAVSRLAASAERLGAMREAATEAAKRAQWNEVLARFEDHLLAAADARPREGANVAALA